MKYEVLWDGNRIFSNPLLQYIVVFMMRRTAFVMLIYYMTSPEMVSIQIFLNILINFSYTIYSVIFKPLESTFD
jgi:hypothetical protein